MIIRRMLLLQQYTLAARPVFWWLRYFYTSSVNLIDNCIEAGYYDDDPSLTPAEDAVNIKYPN